MAEQHTLQMEPRDIWEKKLRWQKGVEACTERLCWCTEPIMGLEQGIAHMIRVIHVGGIKKHGCSFSGDLTDEMNRTDNGVSKT